MEIADEFRYLNNMSDDDLFNALQQSRVDLACEELDVEGRDTVRIKKLEDKIEIIEYILDRNGQDAHRMF